MRNECSKCVKKRCKYKKSILTLEKELDISLDCWIYQRTIKYSLGRHVPFLMPLPDMTDMIIMFYHIDEAAKSVLIERSVTGKVTNKYMRN